MKNILVAPFVAPAPQEALRAIYMIIATIIQIIFVSRYEIIRTIFKKISEIL